jgi:hypothetical protein
MLPGAKPVSHGARVQRVRQGERAATVQGRRRAPRFTGASPRERLSRGDVLAPGQPGTSVGLAELRPEERPAGLGGRAVGLSGLRPPAAAQGPFTHRTRDIETYDGQAFGRGQGLTEDVQDLGRGLAAGVVGEGTYIAKPHPGPRRAFSPDPAECGPVGAYRAVEVRRV